MLFLDAKDHGVDALESLPGPRIAMYGSSLMRRVLAKNFPPHMFLDSMLAVRGSFLVVVVLFLGFFVW